jgi:hypothetical protein
VIREDRELSAKLTLLITATAPLAMCIMDRIASAAERQNSALLLIAAGERLPRRADGISGAVVEGEVPASGPLTLLHSEP